MLINQLKYNNKVNSNLKKKKSKAVINIQMMIIKKIKIVKEKLLIVATIKHKLYLIKILKSANICENKWV